MQSSAPEAVDLEQGDATRPRSCTASASRLTDDFGRKCLLARRLVERGVRFIQLYSGTNIGEDWDDAHNDLQASHTKMCKKTDQPITALLTDLKARGMLDSTLVVWNSEFGRTPLAEGHQGPRPSSLRIQHVDGGRRHSRRPGARLQRRFRAAPRGVARTTFTT